MDRIDKTLGNHPRFAEGAATAEQDIVAGMLRYRVYGKIVPWWRDVATILKERYGITFTVVGSCITEMDTAAMAAGYNQRMQSEFESRFGANVIDSVFREVERKQKKYS